MIIVVLLRIREWNAIRQKLMWTRLSINISKPVSILRHRVLITIIRSSEPKNMKNRVWFGLPYRWIRIFRHKMKMVIILSIRSYRPSRIRPHCCWIRIRDWWIVSWQMRMWLMSRSKIWCSSSVWVWIGLIKVVRPICQKKRFMEAFPTVSLRLVKTIARNIWSRRPGVIWKSSIVTTVLMR